MGNKTAAMLFKQQQPTLTRCEGTFGRLRAHAGAVYGLLSICVVEDSRRALRMAATRLAVAILSRLILKTRPSSVVIGSLNASIPIAYISIFEAVRLARV